MTRLLATTPAVGLALAVGIGAAAPEPLPNALSSVAAAPAPSASLHEDDPKMVDPAPPYRGRGYRGAWAARAGGSRADLAAGGGFDSQGVTLLSWLTLADFGGSSGAMDCWGYTSPSGREYAMITLTDGTAFVEITNPSNPVVIDKVLGPSSGWRDIKVWDDHAYIVNETGDGIQVVSMENIDSGQVPVVNTVLTGSGSLDSHNVAIDTTSGFLYRCGGGPHGLRIYDLSNKVNPQFVGAWDDRYIHDAQAFTYTSGPFAGRQIVFANSGFNGGFTDTRVELLDVTDKQNIFVAGTVFYPNPAYSHQSWLSDDLQYLFVDDELDEGGSTTTTTHVIDVSDIDAPFYAATFTNGNTAVGHNLYTRGSDLFEANYSSGMRVFDVSDALNGFEYAWFDTRPEDDDADFDGLWSVFPYYDSGLVIGSDRQRGLFVWTIAPPEITFSYPNGVPSLVDPGGESVIVQIAEDPAGSLIPGSAQLNYDLGQGIVTAPLVDLGGGSFRADLPEVPCGASYAWWVTADSQSAITWKSPGGPGSAAHEVQAILSETIVFEDAVESATGWVAGLPSDDATTGQWTFGDPLGTGAQPEEDHTPSGSSCWFTGQGTPGGTIGENDVDGGTTTLTSPAYDLSSYGDPLMRYWRWYSNNAGATPNTDVFVVEISSDGGNNWLPLETVGPDGDETSGTWRQFVFRVSDFVPVTNTVQLRFIASDLGEGSIVEAAIDDVGVVEYECPPLAVDTLGISVSNGGQQNFVLDAGDTHAGELHMLLGSITGTSPGLPLGGFVLPLVQDGWTNFTANNPNSPPLSGFVGFLDGNGRSSASFTGAPGGPANLVGVTLFHAYLLLELPSGAISFTSNPVSLNLLP